MEIWQHSSIFWKQKEAIQSSIYGGFNINIYPTHEDTMIARKKLLRSMGSFILRITTLIQKPHFHLRVASKRSVDNSLRKKSFGQTFFKNSPLDIT